LPIPRGSRHAASAIAFAEAAVRTTYGLAKRSTRTRSPSHISIWAKVSAATVTRQQSPQPCGPPLPEGVLEDDGAERGIIFIFLGAHIDRQFVKSQWLNDGNFVSVDREKDLLAGDNDGTGTFTIPQRPVWRRLQDVLRFTITRGGEYCFVPGIRVLHWPANLDT
jgi:hypothetical protein